MDTATTTAPIAPGAEWGRPGDFRTTHGLSRSTIYELIAEGKVRSACLRREGRRTGIRLVSVQSVRDYIASFAA